MYSLQQPLVYVTHAHWNCCISFGLYSMCKGKGITEFPYCRRSLKTLHKFPDMHIEIQQLSPGLLCSKFCLLCFWVVLKKLPVMLNIMPIATAIMPQFIHSFIIFNDIYISIFRLQPAVVFYIMLCCSILIFTHYAMLSIMLMRKHMSHFAPSWHDYCITIKIVK